jgi:hypothetical protein
VQVRATGSGPGLPGFGKRDSGKRDSGKRDSEKKTGFRLHDDLARPAKNWIISVCALQLQLQSFKPINRKKWAIL